MTHATPPVPKRRRRRSRASQEPASRMPMNGDGDPITNRVIMNGPAVTEARGEIADDRRRLSVAEIARRMGIRA